MTNNAITIRGLRKVYPNGHEALKGVDFSIPKGGFVALLGENGAGKSTLINIVSGLVPKTFGEVNVLGRNLDRDPEGVKRVIGVMPQEINLNIFEKCIDIVTTVGGYYGIPTSVAQGRAEQLLSELGLADKRDVQARMLSGGMKRRLMLARALIHEPELLILDEPTAGVDVALRRGMWEYLKELQQKTHMTILLTTHYLEEVEALCDAVTILDHGSVVISDTVKNVTRKLDQELYVIDTDRNVPSDVPGFVSFRDGSLEVLVSREHSLSGVLDRLRGLGINLVSIRPKENRLESFFLSKK